MLKEITISILQTIFFYILFILFGSLSSFLILKFMNKNVEFKKNFIINFKIFLIFYIITLGFKLLTSITYNFSFNTKFLIVLFYLLISIIAWFYYIFISFKKEYNLKTAENMILNFLYFSSLIFFYILMTIFSFFNFLL